MALQLRCRELPGPDIAAARLALLDPAGSADSDSAHEMRKVYAKVQLLSYFKPLFL